MTGILVIFAGYLLGSIPFGYLAGRLRGIDIRTVGSKNVGATNVFRTLGKGMGVGVMVLDIGKGVAAVLIAKWLTDDPWPLFAATAAVGGHVFPVWLRFRGGKGVATGAGVVIGLMPLTSLVLIGVWVAIVLATRYVSLASIVGAAACTPVAALLGEHRSTLIFSAAISAAVLIRHRENAVRLMKGTERQISLGRTNSSET